MKSVAEVKAISIGTKKQIETNTQIAKDYEQKAIKLLQKAKRNEISQEDADRLASEALKKQKVALAEVQRLTDEAKKYDIQLEQMEKKVLELKNQIQKWEKEYQSLKARATVAKTTKRINQQLSNLHSDSTTSMLEDMKNRIQAEENLAEAYGQMNAEINTSVDDEINNALGCDDDVTQSLEALKQNLLTDNIVNTEKDDLELLKKQIEE